jgi:hypothetical protein
MQNMQKKEEANASSLDIHLQALQFAENETPSDFDATTPLNDNVRKGRPFDPDGAALKSSGRADVPRLPPSKGAGAQAANDNRNICWSSMLRFWMCGSTIGATSPLDAPRSSGTATIILA